MKAAKLFSITRKFTGGVLEGIEHTDISSVAPPVGFECLQPLGGSPYIVTKCEEISATKVVLVD
jgi:hypothetical protein